MSRRIDIELTSALPDDSWTWRAAGAKQPKGTLDGAILSAGASVGDVIKVEVEQQIDGITVLSVVGGREKAERSDLLELLPSENDFKPVIETKAKRDRNDRGGDRGPRRDRDGRKRRDGKGGRGRGDGNERGGRDNRGGRGRGPSFTPPPEIPQRPKPKRLKPGKKNRNEVLAELPDEQRGIAEVALQGMGAVRQRLQEENQKAAAEGRSPMPEASVLKMAEDLLPKLRVAEWRDRAEAAQRQMEHLDLRDLRSVVAAAGDPAVARDETTSALATELTDALATKQEQELALWFGDVDAALAVGRVIRALRLSSQPPKAGVPFPSDIAQRLVESTNASLAPMDSSERWIAMLEAAAFSPVRASIAPVRKPDAVTDELLATVKRLGPALPQVALLFEVEVDPKAPMPKPLRPGPRNRKGAQEGDRGGRGRKQKPSGKGGRSGDKQGKGGAPAAQKRRDEAPAKRDEAVAAAEPADRPTVVEDVPVENTGSAPAPEATDEPPTAQDQPAPAAESTTAPAPADEPAGADETAPSPEPTAAPAPAGEPASADDEPVPSTEPTAAPAPADEPAIADDEPAPSTEPTAALAPADEPATSDEQQAPKTEPATVSNDDSSEAAVSDDSPEPAES